MVRSIKQVMYGGAGLCRNNWLKTLLLAHNPLLPYQPVPLEQKVEEYLQTARLDERPRKDMAAVRPPATRSGKQLFLGRTRMPMRTTRRFLCQKLLPRKDVAVPKRPSRPRKPPRLRPPKLPPNAMNLKAATRLMLLSNLPTRRRYAIGDS